MYAQASTIMGQNLDLCWAKLQKLIQHNTRCRSQLAYVPFRRATKEQKDRGFHYTENGQKRVAIPCPMPPFLGYASCLGGVSRGLRWPTARPH
jgi:hypothetical protein